MGRRRGFFAELQHQNQVAARQRERAAKAAAREHAAAIRRAEQAQRQAERARAQALRAAAADQKRAEQESRRLHIEAMEAEAASMNAQLANDYDEIDSMLAATLTVDDFVDLEQLRAVPEHPPFKRTDLEQPIPPPPPIVSPPEPRYVEPQTPKGLSGMLGGKKRHAEAVAQARAAYASEHQAWQVAMSQVPSRQLQQMQAHQQQEQHRLDQLAKARKAYDLECQERQSVADAANQQLDKLIADLGNNVEAAVQEYVSIVLGNSVYPDCFAVEHEFEFDSGMRELSLTVAVPGPEELPNIKAYKYNKANDEITSSTLPQKDLKERYASAVHQVAIRTLHEVFEADRAGRIMTISASVGTESIDPATGQLKRTPLVAVAADRQSFMSFDLSRVVPLATLEHLNALVSKNPFGLVAIDESKGVRGS
jgi:restriction system protein